MNNHKMIVCTKSANILVYHHEEEYQKLSCGICNDKRYHDGGLYGGFGSFSREELDYLDLDKLFKKYPQIINDDLLVCEDCINEGV